MSADPTLAGFEDVPGVIGSFLAASDGSILAIAMPRFVSEDELRRVGPRARSIFDTFDEAGQLAESCVLRFAEHRLYLKPLGIGMLCVLTQTDVNYAALRMAARLIARKLEAGVLENAPAAKADERSTWRPPAAHKPQPRSPGAPALRDGAARAKSIVYRGRKYEV